MNKNNLLPVVVYKKNAVLVANRVDPDETPRSVASHLGLHFLLRPVCPNTYAKCGILRDTVATSESSDRTT